MAARVPNPAHFSPLASFKISFRNLIGLFGTCASFFQLSLVLHGPPGNILRGSQLGL